MKCLKALCEPEMPDGNSLPFLCGLVQGDPSRAGEVRIGILWSLVGRKREMLAVVAEVEMEEEIFTCKTCFGLLETLDLAMEGTGTVG